MTTLPLKLSLVLLAMAVHDVSARFSWNECKGKSQLGKPCQDGTGVCVQVEEPGERFGQMECKNVTPFDQALHAPGYPGEYELNLDVNYCWTSPDDTTITLTFPWIDVECGNCRTSCFTSPWFTRVCWHDWIRIYETDDGTYDEVCSSQENYVYVSASNKVCMLFHTDGKCAFRGFEVIATYA